MEPVQVGPDGGGRCELECEETDVAMEALSDAGGFVWSVGEERNTLLVSSGTEMLWHQFTLVSPATVRFLTCTVR